MSAKKHSITLSIPKPCHEGWDNMTVTEQGRHCSSCNKTVIDFSLYTDRQLIEFFKGNKGSICGRINPYQVDNTIIVTELTNRSFFYKLFMGSAVASWLGLGTSAHAQQAAPNIIIIQQGTALHPHALRRPLADTSCRISGKVVDRNQEPITDATVSFYSAADDSIVATVYTDSTGSFTANIPEKYYQHSLSYNASSSRYKNVHEDFVVKKTQYFKIELTHFEEMIMGKMIPRSH